MFRLTRPGLLLRRATRAIRGPLEEPPAPESCLRLDLSGRVALVTGGTGQVGRCIARSLAACGADIALHAHRSNDESRLQADGIRALGVRCRIVSGDVTLASEVARMKQEIAGELGGVDIVVINAITWHARAGILDLDPEEFDRVYATSTRQAVNLAQQFVPGMVERRWGRIIAISSEVAMQGLAETGPYTAAKRGMDGVMRVLSREVGPHQITVNTVAPGWIICDHDRQEAIERQPAYESSVPMKRRGFDQDVANAVAFLASDLAGFISGTFLPVCGGNVMPAI